MNRKIFLSTAFALSAVGVGIALSIKPWQVYREQRKAADAEVVEMRQAEKNRTDLTRRKAQFESAIGKEELARSQGYRQANETPVDLENHSNTNPD